MLHPADAAVCPSLIVHRLDVFMALEATGYIVCRISMIMANGRPVAYIYHISAMHEICTSYLVQYRCTGAHAGRHDCAHCIIMMVYLVHVLLP